MPLRILKHIFAAVVIVAETRKLSVGAESELALLRQENTRLTRVLSDLQQNYSSFITEQKTEQADGASGDVQDEAKRGHQRQMAAQDCLENAIKLLEESIHVYDDFIKTEINRAECELCHPECYGWGEGSCEMCSDYREPECDVAKHVDKTIVRPFAKRANELRDKADGMISALHKSLKIQFGVSMDYVE